MRTRTTFQPNHVRHPRGAASTLDRASRHALFSRLRSICRFALCVCFALSGPAWRCGEALAQLPDTSKPSSPKPGTILTVAGTGRATDDLNLAEGVRTNIGNPFGVELGPRKALYICEVQNHRLRRLDAETGRITNIAGTGKMGIRGDGGPAEDAELNEPYEVRFDGQGNIYFVEMRNHIVRRIDAKTKKVTTVAGSGKPGARGDGGPATRAQLNSPHSIALDSRGFLYIADIGNHRVRRVDMAKSTIDSIAGNGEKGLPVDGAPIRGRPLSGPRALAVRGRMLWIALREGHSIWKLNLDDGRMTHVAGTGALGHSGDGGPAKEATFNGPKGIAVDAQDNCFVVDTENQAIRRIDGKTGLITTIAGSGPKARGFQGDGGPATKAWLNRPHGICVGPDGTVYIGDSENHRVRIIVPERPPQP